MKSLNYKILDYEIETFWGLKWSIKTIHCLNYKILDYDPSTDGSQKGDGRTNVQPFSERIIHETS